MKPREWNLLHDQKGGPCRLCGDRKYELHHLVNRKLGGDDTADNLVPLCRDHHRAVQFDQVSAAKLWEKLTAAERAYVTGFLGRYYKENL